MLWVVFFLIQVKPWLHYEPCSFLLFCFVTSHLLLRWLIVGLLSNSVDSGLLFQKPWAGCSLESFKTLLLPVTLRRLIEIWHELWMEKWRDLITNGKKKNLYPEQVIKLDVSISSPPWNKIKIMPMIFFITIKFAGIFSWIVENMYVSFVILFFFPSLWAFPSLIWGFALFFSPVSLSRSSCLDFLSLFFRNTLRQKFSMIQSQIDYLYLKKKLFPLHSLYIF